MNSNERENCHQQFNNQILTIFFLNFITFKSLININQHFFSFIGRMIVNALMHFGNPFIDSETILSITHFGRIQIL